VKLFWRQTPPFPIPSGCRFGSGGHGEQGGRWPAYISLLILVDLDRLPKPIGLCGSCLLSGGVSGWRRRGWGKGSSKLSSDAVSFSMSGGFPASSVDDGAWFVIQLSCRKLDPLCIPRDESFACLTQVASGTGRWSGCRWWCWCGRMLSSSSSLRLVVADIRSLISRHAGGAEALDVVAVSRFGAVGGDGRRIRAGLSVRRRRPEIWRKSSKGIDACNLTCSRVFFCKIPGMYCASLVIQSLFRKKKEKCL
jgi:hypothetical protein